LLQRNQEEEIFVGEESSATRKNGFPAVGDMFACLFVVVVVFHCQFLLIGDKASSSSRPLDFTGSSQPRASPNFHLPFWTIIFVSRGWIFF
jgi:hypothetical protein